LYALNKILESSAPFVTLSVSTEIVKNLNELLTEFVLKFNEPMFPVDGVPSFLNISKSIDERSSILNCDLLNDIIAEREPWDTIDTLKVASSEPEVTSYRIT
jgi:hypothetical protein